MALERRFGFPVFYQSGAGDSLMRVKTLEGAPVHSFQTLLPDLSTIVRNSITPNLEGAPAWQQQTEPLVLSKRRLICSKNIRSNYRPSFNRKKLKANQ